MCSGPFVPFNQQNGTNPSPKDKTMSATVKAIITPAAHIATMIALTVMVAPYIPQLYV